MTPVELIVAGDAIVVAIVIVVLVISHDLVTEGGVSVAIPTLSLSSPTSSAVAALFPPLNLCRSTSSRPTLTLHGAHLVYHHHCPPVRASPTTFRCRLPPLLIVKCPPSMPPTIVMQRRPHLWTRTTSLRDNALLPLPLSVIIVLPAPSCP